MKHRPAIFAIVVTVVLCLSPTHSMACSCGKKPPPMQALAGAAAVFSGRVVASSLGENGELYKASIRVMDVWKGNVYEHIEVLTYWRCCLCGFALEVGRDYLVYAYSEGYGQLWVSICSRTVLLEQAATDLSALGRPLRSYSLEGDSKPKGESPNPGGRAEKGRLALHGCIPGLLPSEHLVVIASHQTTTWGDPIKADGCYRFQDLEPGDYSVSAHLINTDHVNVPGCLFERGRQIQRHIKLAPGDPEAVLDLDLALGNRTLTVHPTGAEQLGRLFLRLPSADGETLIESFCREQDGTLHIGRLREGSYRLQIMNLQGQVLMDKPVEVTSDPETVVEIQGPAKP